MWNRFAILICVVAVCNAATVGHSPLRQLLDSDQIGKTLPRILALALVDRLTETGKFPVVTPLPDPIDLPDTHLSFPEGGATVGNISFCRSAASGTRFITDDLTFSLAIPPKVNYVLKSPSLRVAGENDVDLSFLGLLHITSRGDYSIHLEVAEVSVELRVNIHLSGRFDILKTSVEIGFGGIVINAAAEINGEPIVWEEINAALPELFATLWPEIKPTVDQLVTKTAQEVFSECNIYTLIDGDFTCVGLGKKSVREQLMEEISPFQNKKAICPPAPTPTPDDGSYLIFSDNITDAGRWPEGVDRCPKGSFANGFQVKTEPYQTAFSDDTTMNGLRLFCSGTEHSVTSVVGGWGNWGKPYACDNGGLIKGFQMRIEEGGEPDKTAANNIRMICPNGSIEGDGLGFGLWRGIFTCGDGFVVCGLKTQVEPDQGPLIDDTSLNNIALLCCPNPMG